MSDWLIKVIKFLVCSAVETCLNIRTSHDWKPSRLCFFSPLTFSKPVRFTLYKITVKKKHFLQLIIIDIIAVSMTISLIIGISFYYWCSISNTVFYFQRFDMIDTIKESSLLHHPLLENEKEGKHVTIPKVQNGR